MKKKKQNKQQETANVEFGVEFGELNAAKMYEKPFPQKKKNSKKS